MSAKHYLRFLVATIDAAYVPKVLGIPVIVDGKLPLFAFRVGWLNETTGNVQYAIVGRSRRENGALVTLATEYTTGTNTPKAWKSGDESGIDGRTYSEHPQMLFWEQDILPYLHSTKVQVLDMERHFSISYLADNADSHEERKRLDEEAFDRYSVVQPWAAEWLRVVLTCRVLYEHEGYDLVPYIMQPDGTIVRFHSTRVVAPPPPEEVPMVLPW